VSKILQIWVSIWGKDAFLTRLGEILVSFLQSCNFQPGGVLAADPAAQLSFCGPLCSAGAGQAASSEQEIPKAICASSAHPFWTLLRCSKISSPLRNQKRCR